MFIFNRPFGAVAGALGVVCLMLGLERACDPVLQQDRQMRASGEIDAAVPAGDGASGPATAMAGRTPAQGSRFHSTSSPSRRQMKPETFPSAVR
jgi:hypothetical protein